VHASERVARTSGTPEGHDDHEARRRSAGGRDAATAVMAALRIEIGFSRPQRPFLFIVRTHEGPSNQRTVPRCRAEGSAPCLRVMPLPPATGTEAGEAEAEQ
jgi:hypothetical protein